MIENPPFELVTEAGAELPHREFVVYGPSPDAAALLESIGPEVSDTFDRGDRFVDVVVMDMPAVLVTFDDVCDM